MLLTKTKQMKKKFLFLAATAALVMSSCSNDDIVDTMGNNNDENAIGFRTSLGSEKETKAAVTNKDNITSFTLHGWWSAVPNGADYGDATKGQYFFKAFGMNCGEDASWSYSPVVYWPQSGTMDFFAYSPASSIYVNKGFSNLTTAGEMKIQYTVADPSKTNAQEDFLIAKTTQKSGGKITMHFQHALSRVLFKAAKTDPNMTYLIGSVELLKLHKEGEFDYLAKNASSVSLVPDQNTTNTFGSPANYVYPAGPGGTEGLTIWKTLDALHPTKSNVKVDLLASDINVTFGEYVDILGYSNALMVLPQTTKLGEDKVFVDRNATTPSSLTADAFYIKVGYKAFGPGPTGTIYYGGGEGSDADSYKYVYIPVKDAIRTSSDQPLTFEIGRQYTFNLLLGGDMGDPIKFSVEVADWNDKWNNGGNEMEVVDVVSLLPNGGFKTEFFAKNGHMDTNNDRLISLTELNNATKLVIPFGVEPTTADMTLFTEIEEVEIIGGTVAADASAVNIDLSALEKINKLKFIGTRSSGGNDGPYITLWDGAFDSSSSISVEMSTTDSGSRAWFYTSTEYIYVNIEGKDGQGNSKTFTIPTDADARGNGNPTTKPK